LIYATSNEETKRILFKMKSEMPRSEFIRQSKLFRDLKIFSNNVMTPEEWKLLLR